MYTVEFKLSHPIARCILVSFLLYPVMVVCSGCKQKFPHLDANHCSKCLAQKPGLGPPEIESLNVCFLFFFFFNYSTVFLTES